MSRISPLNAQSNTSPSDTPKEEHSKNEFGALVRQFRNDRGLTLADVAQRMNVTVSYISLLENGHRPPSPKIVGMFKEAFRLTPSEESRLLAASGYSEDALTRAVKYLLDVIVDEMQPDEIDHALMQEDILAVTSGWRDLLYGKQDMLNGQFDSALQHFDKLMEAPDLTPAS